MNSNNKFGICCKCPAITNKTRELTVWSNSHIYDNDVMKKIGITNAHDYRLSLQSNGENIIKNTLNDFEKNYKCVNAQSNVFYIDSSKYNQYYDNLNANSSKEEIKDFDRNATYRPYIKTLNNNATLNSLSLSPFH
jgi:hypothetical protein